MVRAHAMWMQDITGWGESDRGVSYTFGPDVVQTMTEKFGIDLVCRAHQVKLHYLPNHTIW